MITKKLKYQELLSQFPNCPSANYKEIQIKAFRWVHSVEHENDYKPINLINTPPQRLLDETDKMCMGYGLSLFDSFENAYSKFKGLYFKQRDHLKSIFISDKGQCVATLDLSYSDGLGNEPDVRNYGHFTFHEYGSTNMREKIKSISTIFDTDGKFIN
jgi:hypothetical protein